MTHDVVTAPDRDAKWASRDAARARHEAQMQESAARNRKRLVGIVMAGLDGCGVHYSDVAALAEASIAALEDDGVVFASVKK